VRQQLAVFEPRRLRVLRRHRSSRSLGRGAYRGGLPTTYS
jgi:hypothetical protein